MVGSGVFTTSGLLLKNLEAPSRVLWAWAIGGLVALLGALSYGALGRRIPESGGEYLFLSRTFHPALGYIAGWISLLVGFSAPMAAAAYGFGAYVSPWFPEGSIKWAGTLLMTFVAVVHAVRVSPGAWMQNVAVLIKVCLILLCIGLGLSQVSPDMPAAPPTGGGWGVFAVSLVLVSFSYSGWNAVVYLGGEVRQPERNLPWAMLIGTVVVTVLYTGVNLVCLLAADPEVLKNSVDVGRIAAVALGGESWGRAVSLLVALAMATSVSAAIMAGPRVYERMAADGFLPAWLKGGEEPPRVSIAFQFLVALGMLWTTTFEVLLTFIGFTLSLSTACTVAGLIRLRLREGPSLRVPGWPVVPFLFLAFVLFMSWHTMTFQRLAAFYGFLTIGAGAAGYFLTGRKS